MKYGEPLVRRSWPSFPIRYPGFCYRIDPVPFTGKRTFKGIFRHPRTTQERKYSCKRHPDYEYTRGRRRRLPHTWDDICRIDMSHKCWKKQTKKKRQWM